MMPDPDRSSGELASPGATNESSSGRIRVGLREATKIFGGTTALSKVTLDLVPGEVLALLGENGAGKSTCVKLLAGVHRPDHGFVSVNGAPVTFHSPLDAQHYGIAVMRQHPGLFPDLSVAENIFIGHAETDRFGRLQHSLMLARARRLLDTGARTLFINQAKGDSLAEMMLTSMGELINYDGEFAILSSTPTATNQNAWIAFMKARMASDAKYAKMKLVQVAYGQESEQVNQQQALALAQAFPNLKGIIIPAGIGLPAAARAMEQAGLLGKIKLSGLAPATLIKKYIVSGTVQDIWWNVKDLGYLTYYAAQAVASGELTGKEGETFKAGRLGDYKVGKDGEVVLGPAKIVTPANVEEFKF